VNACAICSIVQLRLFGCKVVSHVLVGGIGGTGTRHGRAAWPMAIVFMMSDDPLIYSWRRGELLTLVRYSVHHPQAVVSMTRHDYKPNLQEAKAPRSIRELQNTVKRSYLCQGFTIFFERV
jgi:hypothetical protein